MCYLRHSRSDLVGIDVEKSVNIAKTYFSHLILRTSTISRNLVLSLNNRGGQTNLRIYLEAAIKNQLCNCFQKGSITIDQW